MRSSPCSPPSRQRGAIGLLSAAVVLLSVLAMVLAVDTGRLMMEKRRLQQQADLAALSAAQQFCDGFSNTGTLSTQVLANLTANGFTAANPSDVEVTLGATESVDRRRQFVAGGSSQSVRVRVRRTVPASLIAGGLIGDQITLQAEAAAQRDLIGVLSVGSRLANLNSEQSQLLQPLLRSLLGASVNLNAVAYTGLANANIPLELLRDALGDAGVIADVGTLEDLIDAELGFGTFLSVMASALSANGSTAAATMQALQTQVAGGIHAATTLQLADILVAETGYPNADQALGATVNALDLLMASAMAVNRGSLLTIPNLSVSTNANPLLRSLLGNTLTTSLRLRIIEPPQIAIGRFGYDADDNPRTLARSAQVDATLGINLAFNPADGGLINGVLALIARVEGNIGISVNAAGGSGWLERIDQCPSLLAQDFQFTIGTETEVASLRVGNPTNSANPASLRVGVSLLGLPSIATIDATVGTSARPLLGSTSSVNFDIDLANPNSLPTAPRTVGTNLSTALGGFSWDIRPDTRACVLVVICVPVPLGNVIAGLIGVLSPVLSAVTQLVLEPVLALLGVSVGEVDVRLLGAEQGHGALLL